MENAEGRMMNDEGRITNDELEEGNANGGGEPRLSEASVRSAPRSAAFVAKTAAEWVAAIVGRATPGRLLDDLWLEGELAVCFGEHGAGKSVLAVQAADAIARGCPLVIDEDRFALEVDGVKRLGQPAPAEVRTVLYFDLKLTSLQFARRYTWEPDRSDTKFDELQYKFPEHFIRCEFDLAAEEPDKYKTRAEWLFAEIESQIRSSGAKVVIIDSIERMTGGMIRSREAAFVMSRLNRLKHELGLSILVLAHLSRRSDNSPLAVGRLALTRTISAFADSVFAIGRCRWDERLRYLKHLNSPSADIIYDDEHLPTFDLIRDEGIFLSFWFEDFYTEETMLDPYLDKTRLERADEVKEMAAKGMSQREIALRMDMSLGSVNRSRNMWSPFDDRPAPPPKQVPARPTKIAKTVEQASKNGRRGPLPKPARKQGRNIQLEGTALPNGRASAKIVETVEHTNKTGVPKTAPAEWTAEEMASLRAAHPALLTGHREYDFDPTVVLDAEDIVCDPTHPMFGLKRSIDSNGREIFVVRIHEHNHNPKIWYRYTNAAGRLALWENLYGDSSTSKYVTQVAHTYEPPPPRDE